MNTNPSSSTDEPPTASTSSPPQPPPAQPSPAPPPAPAPAPPSRYESQKRRDWNTFLQYLGNHKPPLSLPQCSGTHVIEFLRYLDQFGKTKVHSSPDACPFYGQPNPPSSCSCPLRQAWGSLDALIGRLRAAYEESGGRPEANPFAARAVRMYLREVRESQAKARGIPYEKKKKKRKRTSSSTTTTTTTTTTTSKQGLGETSGASGSRTGDGGGEGDDAGAPPPPTTGSVS